VGYLSEKATKQMRECELRDKVAFASRIIVRLASYYEKRYFEVEGGWSGAETPSWAPAGYRPVNTTGFTHQHSHRTNHYNSHLLLSSDHGKKWF